MRSESGTSSLEALRGKRALIHDNTGVNLGLMWLNAMLHDAHLGLRERFFSAVEVVDKLALGRVRELWQKTLSLSGQSEPALRPIPAGGDRRVTKPGGAQ